MGYLASKKSDASLVPEKPMDPVGTHLPPVTTKVDCSSALAKLDPETQKLVAAQIVAAGTDKAKLKAIATVISPVNKEVGDCIDKYADKVGSA